MDSQLRKKFENKYKRARRVRQHLRGDQEKPRLCVIKTNKHIHIQLIDDEASHTMASTSTIGGGKKNKESAKQLGLKMAELAKSKNVKRVVFDRGPFKYHGVVAAIAEGAREGGLEV